MKTTLFLCTYKKDFPYLKYFIRSVAKFATGFSGVTILVPKEDFREAAVLVMSSGLCESHTRWNCIEGDEWPGQGMLWHMHEIMHADRHCPDADFIAHIDPDCVFTGPVTPETFIKDGKPILRYEHFDSIGARHPGVLCWRTASEKALPFKVEREFMRGHPEVYHRGLYSEARQLIEMKTGMKLEDYIKTCRNEHPQTFAEYPTLGAVAFHSFKDKYHLHDCALQANPDMQDFPVFQAWSHSAPDVPADLWYRGRQQRIRPVEMYEILGLT